MGGRHSCGPIPPSWNLSNVPCPWPGRLSEMSPEQRPYCALAMCPCLDQKCSHKFQYRSHVSLKPLSLSPGLVQFRGVTGCKFRCALKCVASELSGWRGFCDGCCLPAGQFPCGTKHTTPSGMQFAFLSETKRTWTMHSTRTGQTTRKCAHTKHTL